MKCTSIEKWIIDKTCIKNRDRKELENYQLNKIKETIVYVKNNSKFYKEYLKNVHIDKINSFKDFENIPFTLPDHIRHNSFNFLCVPQKDIARVVTLRSSGTSGKEKRIYFTEKDLELTIEFFKYGMSCLVNKNDKVLVLLPGNTYGSIGDLLKKALSKIDIECYIQGIIVDTKYIAEFIMHKNINCIVGIPIQLLELSRTYRKIFKNKIEKILLSTDYIPETLIQEITNEFGCKVFTHYGMTEMGYGGGVECEALKGYHMREGDLYFEIINPTTGKVVKPGYEGEIVFTTLTREGMPLIRYRTGDIASFNPETCACGTFLKTMNRAQGRMENRIKIYEDKFIYMKDLDEIILAFKEVINYKVSIVEGNIIFINLITLSEEDFNKSSGKIMNCIRNIPTVKEALIKNVIEIVLTSSKENILIKNSMLKRKIYDYRKKG